MHQRHVERRVPLGDGRGHDPLRPVPRKQLKQLRKMLQNWTMGPASEV